MLKFVFLAWWSAETKICRMYFRWRARMDRCSGCFQISWKIWKIIWIFLLYLNLNSPLLSKDMQVKSVSIEDGMNIKWDSDALLGWENYQTGITESDQLTRYDNFNWPLSSEKLLLVWITFLIIPISNFLKFMLNGLMIFTDSGHARSF